MLPLATILQRACLGAIAGLGISLLTSAIVALIVGIAVFYVLLTIANAPARPPWQG